MESYPNAGSRTLFDAHRRMLYDESGIDPGVAAQRGYYSAARRSDVPEAFKNYQRKRGLVVPMFSPDGETVGYQLRPDRPRKKGPKYESPGGISPVVDVHPRMLEEARHGTGPLLITEGAKTGDAATSRGVPTVVLAGVWMWCVPKVKPYRLKPCFDHIRLAERPVFVAFDSDCMSKVGVQEALAALVDALEDRGAMVKVIYLPDAAAKSGKIHADGLRVRISWGTLQVGAKVARRTLSKALGRLEERGFMYRDNKGRKPDKTGAFVLRAKVDQYGSKAPQATQGLRACDPGGLPLRGLPDIPRLRWSRPKYAPRRGLIAGTRRIRNSKSLPPRDRIERLGKIRGAVVDALEASGGALSLQDLAELLHQSRPRDLRRRVLPMLEESGIIAAEGNTVRLTTDWSERLDYARRANGELEADELAERRRKLASRAYHRRHETPKSRPSTAGLEAIKRSHEQRQAGLAAIAERAAAAAKSEELRKAEAFVRDKLQALGRIRLGLLQDIWHDAGGDPWTIPKAVEALGCSVEKLPEYDNRRFVFSPTERVA